MGKIRVNNDVLNSQQAMLRELSKQISEISGRVAGANSSLSWEISASGRIQKRLGEACLYLDQLSRKTGALTKALEEASTHYLGAELTSLGEVDKSAAVRQLQQIAGQAGLGAAMGVIMAQPSLGTESSLWDQFRKDKLTVDASGSVKSFVSEDGESWFKFLSGEASASVKPGDHGYEDDELKEIVKQDKLEDWKYKKSIAEDEDWYEEKATILEGKAEAKVEGSVLEGRVGVSGEAGNLSAEVKALTGEAHASIGGGLYVYDKDKDGNTVRMFSPGVAAELGVSAAALSLAVEGRTGFGEDNNMLGVYGEGEAKALSGEATAKVSLNRNEIKAKASAEANLVEAKGTAGISVLGADVGVSGSVKVGIGAHAEIGFTDGVLKADVGAAIGLGISVGVEVDVGGMVDAVCDAAQSAWDFFF